ncbi:hypothetical protein ACLOJK_004117 [Asimina triloba]
MNLTAVTDTEEVMKRHVDDSLAIVPPIQNSYLAHGGSSYDLLNVIDVGSGPGLPGLIFAIAFPDAMVIRHVDLQSGVVDYLTKCKAAFSLMQQSLLHSHVLLTMINYHGQCVGY